nr:immunoglobulin light chain junction region [Macaca mulatta]MPN95467.1 immunoglobulin light chain junction region [Macaca mulatta]MPN95750.1 immunoglobulin light chain junction region [Macaca mulatta]MPN97808.1 immunoglobulin light chain junction region [Macaca mulatta]MPN98120.1 immunoglobulin light chain junction region [Macaca mulatta]
CQHYYTIPYSF